MAGSPFHGISMTSNALRAFQRALDVTGHNITNVNTPGYTRQTVEFKTAEPSLFTYGGSYMLGNGVSVSSVNRIRDAFLEARRLDAQGDTGRLNMLADGLGKIESLFLEPGGSGISDALDKFWNAWSQLSSNPNEPASRLQVQMAGQTLTSRVRSTYLDLQATQAQTTAAIQDTLRNVQDLANQVAGLNAEIRQKTAMGATPNDLLDLRDQAVRELGQLVDIHTIEQPDGTVTVNMNQLTLVGSDGAVTVPTSYNPATSRLTDGTWNYDVRGGSLKALFEVSQTITDYQGRLDSLANTLRTEVNSVHSTGINPLGDTGVNFFNDSAPQSGAIDFDLDLAIKADSQAIVSSVTGASGDGGLALTLSRMRDTSQATLGGRTFGRFFTDLVTDVGRQTAFARAAADTQAAVNDQIEQQIQSVSGVSLDDEMANMLRFQRSYQAAARALSVFDQMTEDLLGMLR